MTARNTYLGWGHWLRVRLALMMVVPAALIVGLATAQPAGAAPLPDVGDVASSEAQAGTDTASCDINPGVDNPVYNTTCPLWMTSFTDEFDTTQSAMRPLQIHGRHEWITRAAPNSEFLVSAGQRYTGTDYVNGRLMWLRASSVDNGTELWAKAYTTGPVSDLPGFTTAYPFAMGFSPDSRYLYITGWTSPQWRGTPHTLTRYGFVLKVDAATGDTVWAKTISDHLKQPLQAVPRNIEISPDGTRLYVTGETHYWQDCHSLECNATILGERRPPFVPFAVALDTSSGSIDWQVDDTEQGSSMGAFGWMSTLSPDGTRLYQVQTLLNQEDWEFWTDAIRVVGYDTVTGEPVWEDRFDYPEPAAGFRNPQYKPVGVVVSPDGSRVFVTTSHTSWTEYRHADTNFLAIAWDAGTGDLAWTSESDWSSQAGCDDGRDVATDAVLSPTGERLYVIGNVAVDSGGDGRCDGGGSEVDGLDTTVTVGLLSLDTATGQEEWSTLYSSPGHRVAITMFAMGSSSRYPSRQVLGTNAHIKAGAGPGDQGSQVYVSASDFPGDTGSRTNWNLGLGFDGVTGQQIWQAHMPADDWRWTGNPKIGDSVLSPDGDAFYLNTYGKDPDSLGIVTIDAAAYPTAGIPPTAALAVTPADARAPRAVSFDASGSRDTNAGGEITRYRFDFGDGSPPVIRTDPFITYTYSTFGTYTATVTITGRRGGVATASTIVTIPSA